MRATKTSVVALACMACLACGSLFSTSEPPPEDRPYASGSRLRAMVVDGGDGAIVFRRFHDNVLDADCTHQRMSDGSWRCIPQAELLSLAFADDACTERVAVVRGSPPARGVASPDDFATTCRDGAAVPPTFEAFAIGERRTGTVHWMNAGRCEVAMGEPADVALYAVSPTDPSMFARAELRREAQGDELEMEVLVGDDGSRAPVRLRDAKRNAPCESSPPSTTYAVDAAVRCLPTNRARTYGFLDSDCAEPRAVLDGSFGFQCEDPTTAVELLSSACEGRDYRLWRVGARTTQATFALSSAGCLTDATTKLAFAQGEELAKESFPALGVTLLGEGRLKAPYLARAGDRRALVPNEVSAGYGYAFWDSTRSAYCRVEPFADGVKRCVVDRLGSIVEAGPDATATFYRFYADATCTGPQLANPHSGCGDPLYALVSDSSARPIGARPIVGRYEGTRYWVTSDADRACREHAQGANDLWRAGELLAPDDVFARVSERTE